VQITNSDPRENSSSVAFHREVYQAIAAKDGVLAEQLTEKLLKDAIRRLQEAFGSGFKS
jgi:DNA-binding FadR family transcriptional regulator